MARLALTLACGDYDRTRARSYGLNPANLMVLNTFLRYAREQGLAGDGIEPADLFAPETHDALAI